MAVKTHEVLRLWRLPEAGISPGPRASTSTPANVVDVFEPLLDPAGPWSSRPSSAQPAVRHEVSARDDIHSILAAIQAAGSNETAEELSRRARFHEPGIDLERLRVGTVLCFDPVTSPRAPTQAELVKSPIVRDAIEAAWHDSKAHDPNLRHEEGGWIYMNIRTGQVFTHRAPPGSVAGVDLRSPVPFVDAVVVGTFHTHPNHVNDYFELGPSDSDRNWDYSRGIPGIVRSSIGYHTYGWERRRLDLEGPWAYPGTPENDLSGDPGPARSTP